MALSPLSAQAGPNRRAPQVNRQAFNLPQHRTLLTPESAMHHAAASRPR
jgi:hypothetical protein